MLVCGSLLYTRGALFSGLKAIGPKPAAQRRAWAAFCFDAWTIAWRLSAWQQYVVGQQQWQIHRYDGYKARFSAFYFSSTDDTYTCSRVRKRS